MPPSPMSIMLATGFHSSMNFDPSLPNDSRLNFVKKSLAASIIAAQPTILAGLIRAQGGGGGTGTTDPWGYTGNGSFTEWGDSSDSGYGETTAPFTTAQDHDIHQINFSAAGSVIVMPPAGAGESYNQSAYVNINIPDAAPDVQGIFKVKLWQSPASLATHAGVATVEARGEFSLYAPDPGGTYVSVTRNTEKQKCTGVCNSSNGNIAATGGVTAFSTGSSATWSQGATVFVVKIELVNLSITGSGTDAVTFKGDVKVSVTKDGVAHGFNPEVPFEILILSHPHP